MARDFAQSSTHYLASIDTELERLQNLREQVAAVADADEAFAKPVNSVRKGMSPEGRRKIAEAQKARWAKQKKAANFAGKVTTKKAAAKKSAVKKASAKKTAATRTTEQA